MVSDIVDFKDWPKDELGHPIFTSTEDSLFYAKLIADNFVQSFKLVGFRLEILKDLETYANDVSPDFQTFINLTVKAQLLRECSEEVIRIKSNV